MRQRPQYLLAALAASGHPVYFVDRKERETRQADGVTIVPSVRDVPAKHPLLYVHFAPLREVFDRFDDPTVVYDVLDDLEIYDEGEVGLPERHRVRSHHGPLMKSAHAVIASSAALVERHRPERADILLIENGVDAERFGAPTHLPADVPLDRPVIGYHGAIARWFDFDLLAGVATAHPEWSFVLVGPVLPEVSEQAERIERLDNVHLLGERPSDAMPAYVQSFDVGVVWFVVNHLTEAVSPLKLFEYLAAGVPAVATPLPSCAAVPGVRIASSVDEMGTAIAQAMATRDDETHLRLDATAAATWSARIAPLLKRLEEIDRRTVPS